MAEKYDNQFILRHYFGQLITNQWNPNQTISCSSYFNSFSNQKSFKVRVKLKIKASSPFQTGFQNIYNLSRTFKSLFQYLHLPINEFDSFRFLGNFHRNANMREIVKLHKDNKMTVRRLLGKPRNIRRDNDPWNFAYLLIASVIPISYQWQMKKSSRLPKWFEGAITKASNNLLSLNHTQRATQWCWRCCQ